MRLKVVFAGIFLSAALAAPITALSQIAPSATQSSFPLTVGGGFSRYYTDWSGDINGEAIWVDWDISRVPAILRGIGVEAEGRDLNYSRTGDNPKLRYTTIGGGAIYHWRRYDRIQPYAKFLLSFGGLHFSNKPGDPYTHDTRSVTQPGAGVELRAFRNIWVRGDFEYQTWPDFFRHHALDPDGITIGVSYDLGHVHAH